jgi:shikimate dehydrogenase
VEVTITAATRIAAVLGWPVSHSKSPALHNAAFAAAGIDAVFVALPVPPAELAPVIRALAATGALGASVTIPHKEAALAACTRVDPLAARTGAVNCLVFAGGDVVGHNTDAGGFVDALAEAGIAARGRAVLLGGGGAARAVAAGLAAAGARARTPARSCRTPRCGW